jgi:L,D-peptidoglycan transpeptidase YkuD (ErfK/YbiS/YcfS/YnhG family)
MNLVVSSDGWLKAGEKFYRAVYGVGGIGPKKGEGDKVSPEGTWPLRRVFYRADRIEKPITKLPIEAITPAHAWCDVPGDPKYNQFVMLPYPCNEGRLWRDDNLYDLVVVIGYNDDPVIDGKGSEIYLHVVRSDYAPSAGCASVSLSDLLEILPHLSADSTLTFTSETLRGESIKWLYKSL